MSKAAKIIICIVIFLTLGGTAFCIGMSTIGWDFTKLDTTNFTAYAYNDFNNESINKLDIQMKSREVIIKPSTDGNYRVECNNTDESIVSASFENNTLIVTESYNFNFFNSINIFKGFNYDKYKVNIYLPSEILEDSIIKATSGHLDISGLEFKAKLDASISSGKINLNNIKAENLTVTAGSGTINITECEIENDLQTEVSSGTLKINNTKAININTEANSGSIKIENCTAVNKILGKVTSGSFRMENTSANEIEAEANSGLINISKIDAAKTKLSATSGTIKANFTGIKTDYTITVSVTSGSKNVQNQTATTGNNTIEANVQSGSIKLTFA